ncbi:hypothetical protein [Rhizobium leguminosarum]|uniref:hypothetical protein n=1 Tax=Rhizobium leguminosarum TaxID=384 RepID=UPI003F9BCC8D
MNPDQTMSPRLATKTSPAAIPSASRTRRTIPPDTFAHSSTDPTRQAPVAAPSLSSRAVGFDEQAYVGATTITWAIAFIWNAPCIEFLFKFIAQIREGNVDDEDRHHIRL